MTLQERVTELVEQHGSLRAAARAIQLDASYLFRLGSGEKTAPSASSLKAMGLRRTVSYEKLPARKAC